MNPDIEIRGASLHNLKHLDATIHADQITVICGPSGCGKSTLAIDILHAECRRRYLETLSPFVARLAGSVPPAAVDSISGLRPSIAFESSAPHRSGKATVGSATETETLLRTLWARNARLRCPHCHRELEILDSQQMVERIASLPPGSRLHMLAPVSIENKSVGELADYWIPQGFVRAWVDGEFQELGKGSKVPKDFSLVIDRLILKEGMRSRIADSLTMALRVGGGSIWVHQGDTQPPLFLSRNPRCPEHGTLLAELQPETLSPLSTLGQCPTCKGEGKVDNTLCKQCHGDMLQSFLLDMDLQDLSWRMVRNLPVRHLAPELRTRFATLAAHFRAASAQILERLGAMEKLGLGHLSLGRLVQTLSDGEWQRLRMVSLAGGHLHGLLFVLDEPASGLHPRDCEHVWNLLQDIRNQGNTLLLIEHRPEMILRADHLIEMGPGAGELGGEVLRQGPASEILADANSPTSAWLKFLAIAPIALPYAEPAHFLNVQITPFRNLKKGHCRIPVGGFTVVSGISGSGKSTLFLDGIVPALRTTLLKEPQAAEWCNAEATAGIELVQDCSSDGLRASARSTVATATGLMTPLRDLFSAMTESKARGFKPSHFSLNTHGGRCETCQGLGTVEDSAGYGDFVCPVCQGRRFRDEILGIRFKTLNISEILDLPVSRALELFSAIPGFKTRLTPLRDTGLGYLRLGQPTSHLSGGELQRLSLSLELAKAQPKPTLFVFDEPARGLHRTDIEHLLTLFRKMNAMGHTIIAIEHQPTVLRSADWHIEMGPGAGDEGGQVVHCGV